MSGRKDTMMKIIAVSGIQEHTHTHTGARDENALCEWQHACRFLDRLLRRRRKRPSRHLRWMKPLPLISQRWMEVIFEMEQRTSSKHAAIRKGRIYATVDAMFLSFFSMQNTASLLSPHQNRRLYVGSS